jgi:elongation factor G
MRCIAVLGPSHSGKTTLIDHLARNEGGTPLSTTTGLGIGVTSFESGGEMWSAIDCPGVIEAITHTQNALLACDVAVVCVSPDPDEVVLAAPFLRMVEAAGTPCVIFINRMDEPRGRVRDIVAGLQDYTKHVILLRQVPIHDGDKITGVVDLISERAWRYRKGHHSALIEIPESTSEREHEARDDLLEQLSEFDDGLLEELIEDREPASGSLFSISAKVLQDNKLIPMLFGSAEKGNGITRLMKTLRHETPQVDALRQRLEAETGLEGERLQAVGFHAQYRQHVGKTVFIRALDGNVKPGETLVGSNLGGLSAIGKEKEPLSGNLAPGEIALSVKSDQLNAGLLFTKQRSIKPAKWAKPSTPMVARLITPKKEKDEVKLARALSILDEVDPGMELTHEEGSGTPLIRVQGPMHLRNIRDTVTGDFGVKIEEHPTTDIYRETITKTANTHYRHRKQSGGAGQFADVRLIVEPNSRGSGFSFAETVKGGSVPRNYFHSVETGAMDAMEKGPLGFPVIDVGVILSDGKHHSVDSSDNAFRAAARLGIREALNEAVPVLLQPIHSVTFHIPSVYSGSLIPIITSHHGHVLGFDGDPDAKGWNIFKALLPEHVLDELVHSVRSATQGIGHFEHEFDHFEELYGKEAETIIQKHREADG